MGASLPLVAGVEAGLVSQRATRPAAADRIECKVAQPRDAGEWDQFVRGQAESTGYHLWAWQNVFTSAFGSTCPYLLVRRDGTVTGVLPLVEIRSRLFGRALSSLPYVNYGGALAADDASRAALVERATDLARQRSLSYVLLRHSKRLFPALPARDHKVTMLLPLQGSGDAMWSALDRKVRNQIRKAEKSHLAVTAGGAELLDDFYGVFARNMRDLGTPVYGRSLFAAILSHFPSDARLHIVSLEGRPIAGALSYGYRDWIEVPSASSLREHRVLCPNHLMYWTTSLRLRTFDSERWHVRVQTAVGRPPGTALLGVQPAPRGQLALGRPPQRQVPCVHRRLEASAAWNRHAPRPQDRSFGSMSREDAKRIAFQADLFASSRDRFRSTCAFALIFTSAFAAYISWVPFNFHDVAAPTLFDALRTALVPSVESRANFVANIILFVPYGIFGGGAFGLDLRCGVRRALWSVVLLVSSLALSVAIEAAQVFLPGRTPASSDVIAQTLGTVLGLVLWLFVGAELRRWMRTRRRRTDQIVFLLHAAVGCLVLSALFPLDVTVSLSTLAQKYRTGGILLMPFQRQGFEAEFLQNAAMNMIFALPLGAWCVVSWTPRGTRRAVVPAILASALVLAALEACQVFVMSRVADSTDILIGTMGASIGAWVAAPRSTRAVLGNEGSMLAAAGLSASTVLYIVFNWSPFDFSVSRTLFEARWPELMRVPFETYYAHAEVRAIGDFAAKFSVSFPIGLFTALLFEPWRRGFTRVFFIASSLLAACLFYAIEFGQIFLPSRFPDVSDVLIAVLGFGGGLVVPQMLHGGGPSSPVVRGRNLRHAAVDPEHRKRTTPGRP
jgi:FemAB-related protein (PEP-CTERM system-associated)